jgi:hypothetical protein
MLSSPSESNMWSRFCRSAGAMHLICTCETHRQTCIHGEVVTAMPLPKAPGQDGRVSDAPYRMPAPRPPDPTSSRGGACAGAASPCGLAARVFPSPARLPAAGVAATSIVPLGLLVSAIAVVAQRLAATFPCPHCGQTFGAVTARRTTSRRWTVRARSSAGGETEGRSSHVHAGRRRQAPRDGLRRPGRGAARPACRRLALVGAISSRTSG